MRHTHTSMYKHTSVHKYMHVYPHIPTSIDDPPFNSALHAHI